MRIFFLLFCLFLISCASQTIHPFQEDEGEGYYLKEISDTYFITCKGLTKHTIENDMHELMKKIIDENNYVAFYILLTGNMGRSILDVRLTKIIRVKFFKTEKEFQQFSNTYSPFGLK